MSSTVTRLTLVSHAMTEAMRAARFPFDEPVEHRADSGAGPARETGATAPDTPLLRADLVRTGPERRARQTATLLGLSATPDPALRDLDCGEWAGRSMDALDPAELMAWMTDPGFRGHGGESISAVIERVRGWLDTCAGEGLRIVAITHPAVIRAGVLIALAAPPESFWRIDIPPRSATTLHGRGTGWTLRHTAYPVCGHGRRRSSR